MIKIKQISYNVRMNDLQMNIILVISNKCSILIAEIRHGTSMYDIQRKPGELYKFTNKPYPHYSIDKKYQQTKDFNVGRAALNVSML